MENENISFLSPNPDKAGEYTPLFCVHYFIVVPLQGNTGFAITFAQSLKNEDRCFFTPSIEMVKNTIDQTPIYTETREMWNFLKLHGLQTIEAVTVLIEVLMNRKVREIKPVKERGQETWKFFELELPKS